MDFKKKAQENRSKRSVKVWLKMWALYTAPVFPMTLEEIGKRVKKKNGKHYTKAGVAHGFKRLEEMGLINREDNE